MTTTNLEAIAAADAEIATSNRLLASLHEHCPGAFPGLYPDDGRATREQHEQAAARDRAAFSRLKLALGLRTVRR